MRSLQILGAFALAALVPLASAQAPGPDAKVTLSGLPAKVDALKSGSSASVPFKVTLTAGGFGCPNAGTLTVTLSLAGLDKLPKNVSASFEKSNLTFNVPQGVYGATPIPGSPVADYNGSADGILHVNAGDLTQNATGSVTVKADFKGGSPAGCQATPAGDPPASSDSKDQTLTFAGNPPPPPAPPPAKKKGLLPAPDAVVTLGAVAVALAFAARRKR